MSFATAQPLVGLRCDFNESLLICKSHDVLLKTPPYQYHSLSRRKMIRTNIPQRPRPLQGFVRHCRAFTMIYFLRAVSPQCPPVSPAALTSKSIALGRPPQQCFACCVCPQEDWPQATPSLPLSLAPPSPGSLAPESQLRRYLTPLIWTPPVVQGQ